MYFLLIGTVMGVQYYFNDIVDVNNCTAFSWEARHQIFCSFIQLKHKGNTLVWCKHLSVTRLNRLRTHTHSLHMFEISRVYSINMPSSSSSYETCIVTSQGYTFRSPSCGRPRNYSLYCTTSWRCWVLAADTKTVQIFCITGKKIPNMIYTIKISTH